MGWTCHFGEMEGSDHIVRVLYNFEYSKDGRKVWMKEGEALSLLKKTNPDWWQVIRKNEKKAFYVPAAYVEEVSLEKISRKQSSKNVAQSESSKFLPPGRDKMSEKNLFKEFPVSDLKDNEKCVGDKSDKFCEEGRLKLIEKRPEADGILEEKEEEARKLLHDKRKSWAAEELVSELTQMAIARSEPAESDYVNLKVEGERFVIAEDEEMRVPSSLFWQSSGYSKDVRNNPMSSSDELDNSDSLGQSNCVAWQSKYSLSSEGDKTDESIQSFHSLGNESVTSSSRHWRDEQASEQASEHEDRSAESSPYAQVLCTVTGSSTSISIDGAAAAPAPLSSGLHLSPSLERLAQQIKFPSEDVDESLPIAPPREYEQYEAPVYANLDLQGEIQEDEERAEQDDSMLRQLRDKLLQSSCIAGLAEDLADHHHRRLKDSVDAEAAAVSSDGDLDCDGDVDGDGDTELSRDEVDTEDAAEREDDCDNDEDAADVVCKVPTPAARTTAPSEGRAVRDVLEDVATVDVKQKIALWNNNNSQDQDRDRFDEDGPGRAQPRPRKVRAFRALGVVKSASESKVSALVSRHGLGRYAATASDSRSGSEEFLDGSPGSEASVLASGLVSAAKQRFGASPSELNPEGDNLDASDSGLSNKSEEGVLSDARGRRRRASLMRSRRVESCRRYQRPGLGAAPAAPAAPSVHRPQSPPPPSPGQEAARLLPAGWAEFRTTDGRSFYYHAGTGQRRWKPPRRRARQDSGRSASSSPQHGEEGDGADGEDCVLELPAGPAPLPDGWRAVMDQSGQLCYVHPHHGAKWFSSSDNKGRVYFFEENSCESSWNLPNVILSTAQESKLDDDGINPVLSSTPAEDGAEKPIKPDRSDKQEKLSLRNTKSRSMVIVDSCTGKDSKNSFVPRNWPQLFDGDMYILKEGPMYRTKITENGKKLRKNWASCHVVLTELLLLLFRDAKSSAAMKSSAQGSTAPRPELCVDLNGALIDQIDRGDKASVTSRKNVFLVSTVLGLQVLFQCDSSQQAEEWFNAVHTAIHNLPSGFDSCPRIKVTKEMDRLFAESNSPEQTKKFPRIGRSKSVKIKNKEGSIEDLTVSVAERQTKIRARLKKFFNRRPTMESLVKKGIWKDEPAFGCYLEQVCGTETPRVPLFVQRCIAVIESSEDNMKTDGLYRASGNLSQVQKIRLQVDQNNLSAMDQEEDVHVLTGALKLFFRELKEPLIPYTAFSKAIKASTIQNKKDKIAQFRELVKSLPSANHDTLKMLLKHLLKVTGYQEFNRMHIPNLAIVFGPTLMWPEQESQNMALDLMQQNLVIEAFLLDFENIFR